MTDEPDVIGLLRDMASGEIRITYEAGDEGEGSDTICHGRISSILGYDDEPEDRAVWNAWSAAMAQDFIELQEHAERWWSVPYVLTDAGKQELNRSGSR